MRALFSRASSLVAAAFLLASSLPAFSAGTVEAITNLRIPGGNNEYRRVLVQADGKPIAIGTARWGTMQFSATRYNVNGTLDTSYGDGGTLIEPIGPGDSEAWAGALQPDGKLVMAGWAQSNLRRFALARFNTDGTFDVLFNGGGLVTQFGDFEAEAHAVVVQPDGKIVAGGYAISNGRRVFAMARYNANGSLDTTFGTGGRVTRAPGISDEAIHALAIQPDGKIVAAGEATPVSDPGEYVLIARYNSNGTPDTTFSGGGALYKFGIVKGRDMALRSDGKIYVVGTVPGSPSRLGILRINADGNVDNGYGASGVVSISAGGPSSGFGLALQTDNKVAVSGSGETSPGQSGVIVARFESSGAIDTTFGASGVSLNRVSSADVGFGLALRPGGGYYVSGRANDQAYDSVLYALADGGLPDPAFNAGGTPGHDMRDLGSRQASARASILQPDGKIVVAGIVTNEQQVGGQQAIVARFLADDTLDTTFSGTRGYALYNGGAKAIALAADGKIVTGGYSPLIGGGSAPSFARLLPNGLFDTSFGNAGVALFPPDGTGSEDVNAIALQPDGKIVAAGYSLSGPVGIDAIFFRVATSGNPDASFSGDGRVKVPLSGGANYINAIVLQPDGKIVGAGRNAISSTRADFALARLNGDGTLDGSFGTGGIVTTQVTAGESEARALSLLPGGKLIAAGYAFNGVTNDFAVARYNVNGTLDATFGNGGTVTHDFGNHNRIFGLAIMGNGQLVAAGETGGQFAVARYFASGALDPSFGSGGSTMFVVNAGADFAYAVTLGLDGKIHASGTGSGLFTVARLSNEAPNATASANLSISQSASSNPASTGKDVMFTLTASNGGPAAATGVTIVDTLPSGWTFVWASPGCSNSAGTVTCAVGNLANGASATFKVVARPVSPSAASNEASIAGAQFDPATGNNTSALALTANLSPAGTPVIRYRLYSPVTQEHLFTTDKNEYDTLGAQAGTWNKEGESGKVLNNPGTFNGVTAVPYYRLYNKNTRWHHWTTDANEYYTLIQFAQFNAEGVDGYLLPTNTTGATQLYRLLYPDGRGLHHWTIDAVEYNQLITNYGWIGEGGSGFVIQ